MHSFGRLIFAIIIALTVSASFLINRKVSAVPTPLIATCTAAPPGMVAWWPGEGNGNDIRGENSFTSSIGTPQFITAEVEHGLKFDGSSGEVAPDSPGLNFGAGSFSLDLSTRIDALPGLNGAVLVEKRDGAGIGYVLTLDQTGVLSFTVRGDSGSAQVPTTALSAGGFHQIAVTVDRGANNAVTIYVDGVAQTPTQPVSSIGNTTNTGRLFVGHNSSDSGTTAGAFNGVIDELELFSRALDITEIQTIFNAGRLGKCRPRLVTQPLDMVGWWDGDDDPFDRQGTNHGTFEFPPSPAYMNGKVGRAFNFNGTTSYVDLDDYSALRLSGPITIDAWVMPTGIPNTPVTVQQGKATNAPAQSGGLAAILTKWQSQFPVAEAVAGDSYGLWLENQSGTLTLFGAIVTGCSTYTISGGTIPLNVWSHVAMTYDGTDVFTLYVNGVQVAFKPADECGLTGVSSPVNIGCQNCGAGQAVYPFQGQIDEVELFNRGLAASEIQDLNDAASAGKFKLCLAPPSGMVGWWTGDANTRDDSGNGNPGTPEGGLGYTIGKVGQAFSLNGTNADVKVPASSSLDVGAGGGLTIDLWINPDSATTTEPLVEWNNPAAVAQPIGTHLWISTNASGDLFANLVDTSGTFHILSSSGGAIVAGAYQHVALTYDNESGMATLYRNGVIVAGPTNLGTFTPQTSFDLYLGDRPAGTVPLTHYAGSIEEVEIFNRTLTQSEIQSIVAAGASGKCKATALQSLARAPADGKASANSPQQTAGNGIHPDANETDQLGDSSITLNNVDTPGVTTYQTLPTYQVGPMPFGYDSPLEVVDISTTTSFSGNVQVCFNLQSVSDQTTFNQLRVLHLEGNILVDRTSSHFFANRSLCATAPTLSPFAISQNPNATPTAANATISGTIVTPDGAPVAGVTVQLSGTENTATITDSNGSYGFGDVETNGFYSVTPSRVNYTFAPATRSFSLLGAHTEASFTASTNTGGFLNPLDTSGFFVRQQYLDFLGREPDASGFDFWNGGILSCGSDASCVEVKRINTSAAFFLSIEFQNSGYLVYRMYKAAYGNLPGTPVPIRFSEFLPDTREVGQGVIVNNAGWEQTLRNNKEAFAAEFVARPRFNSLYGSMSNGQFVDALNQNAGGTLSSSERDALVTALTSGSKNRAQVLREVAENPNLASAEFNRAFVLMEYFAYLRRDPNQGPDTDFAGYNFWLAKLNQFNGNFERAEMVKAFIAAGEYRRRFAQ